MKKFILKSLLLLPLSLFLFLSITFEGVVEEPIRDRIFESEDNVEQELIDQADRELNYVPENIKKAFVNSGWRCFVTTDDLADTWFPDTKTSVRGVTLRTEQTILIEAREDAVKEAVVHEFGHYLDYMCGMPSDSKEFLKIYREEVKTFRAMNAGVTVIDDSGELFAETFKYLMKDPSKCTPKAAAFVERYTDDIGN